MGKIQILNFQSGIAVSDRDNFIVRENIYELPFPIWNHSAGQRLLVKFHFHSTFGAGEKIDQFSKTMKNH